MRGVRVQCRKCRRPLFESEPCLYNVHGARADVTSRPHSGDCEHINDSLYLEETTLPLWIKTKIEQEGWLRGKLLCPKCGSRLGSFDFVTGQRCPCSRAVVPPVHLVRSKVDIVAGGTLGSEMETATGVQQDITVASTEQPVSTLPAQPSEGRDLSS